MELDINKILEEAKQKFEAMALKKVPVILATVTLYTDNAEARLAAIADTYATDKDEEYVKLALSHEQKIFESEYLSLYLLGKQIADEAQTELIAQISAIVMQILAQLIIKAV